MFKKSLIVLSIVSLFSVVIPTVASADQACGDPTLNNASSTTQFIACGNGPINYTMPWGDELTLPRVAKGSFVTDESGFRVYTPNVDFGSGFVDLTHTDYYRNKMRSLSQELKSKSLSPQFSQFNYWLSN